MEKAEDIKFNQWKAIVAGDLRKELESFSYGKKPPEQWTYEEKQAFCKWCAIFNNLYMTIGASLDNEAIEKIDNVKTNGSLYFKDNQTRIQEAIMLGEASEIFIKGTSRDFYKNIRQALIDSGADFSKLKELSDKKEEFYFKMVEGPRGTFVTTPPYNDLYREYLDVSTSFYISILPAVFILMENYGYTQIELAR